MKKLSFVLFLVAATVTVYSQGEVDKGLEAITEQAVKGQLEFLASDWTEGRAVGTKGAYMAADYIASMFKVYGIEPFGDTEMVIPSRAERMRGEEPFSYKSYFQNFSLMEYSPGDEQTFAVISKHNGAERAVTFNYKTDFDVQVGSVGQSVNAPLVFAGYGFKDNDENYNDLANVDVKGKVVVILSGFPGHKDTTSAAYEKFAPSGRYARYYLERNKREQLEEMGAAAIIQLSQGSRPETMWAQNRIYPVKGDYYEADEPLRSYYDTRTILPGDELNPQVPVFNLSSRAASHLLEGSGIDPEQFNERAAQEMKPASQLLAGKSVSFNLSVDSKIIKARNVLGYIEGENKDEFIVVGGHYDHVGKWNGWIWNGADDNASGTVGVMTIARAFKATGKKPEKSILFAAWTGEEKGLWGSRYFVKNAMENEMNIVLNLNYDMIARDSEDDSLKNQASMVYTEANSGIQKLTERNLDEYAINLDVRFRPSERPTGGSDHAPFAQENIPVFYFMAAMHPDYHLPSDELSKINWEKMTNIIKIGFLNTWELANSNEFLEPDEVAEE
ncbi:MAG: M20/M25/M40 family metallo-hydrolase [Bacteroidota bacterium]